MRTTRLEAFSDGVFAIVITLLVLDIRIPEVQYVGLGAALWAAGPRISAYVLSFIVIGLYWVFHYVYVDRIKLANGTLIGLNLLTLLLVSFMPIPTSLIGRYPLQPLPILLYGLCLIAINVTGVVTLIYLQRNPALAREDVLNTDFKAQLRVYWLVNVPYLLACAVAFVLPVVSYVIFFAILAAVAVILWKRLNVLRAADAV